jgi:hypothetical protein
VLVRHVGCTTSYDVRAAGLDEEEDVNFAVSNLLFDLASFVATAIFYSSPGAPSDSCKP